MTPTTPCTYTQTDPMPPPSFPRRDEVLAAVREQKGCFEGATGSRRRAQESQKFLALLLYTALPPGRTKEFQTLHVAIHDTLPQPAVDQARPNCLHITADGRRAYLLLADYKTHKSYGDHFVPLDEGTPLLRHLAVHLNDHRKVLLGAEQQTTVLFLVSMYVHMHTPPPSPSQCIYQFLRNLFHFFTFESLTRFFLVFRMKGVHRTAPVHGHHTLRASLNVTPRKG